MLVERDDKRPDLRLDEIQRDWISWAVRNGYTPKESLPVEYEGTQIVVEVWENPTQEDRYLIYLPRISHTVGDGGEKLFITGQDRVLFMIDAVKKMAHVALILAMEKWKVRQDQKAQLN